MRGKNIKEKRKIISKERKIFKEKGAPFATGLSLLRSKFANGKN